MKLSKIFALAACLLYLNSANATTACVPDIRRWSSPKYSVSLDLSGQNMYTNILRSSEGVEIPFTIVSACGLPPSGSEVIGMRTSVSGSDNSTCWCKIVSPFVTEWVSNKSGLDNCSYNCMNWCYVTFFANDSTARFYKGYYINNIIFY